MQVFFRNDDNLDLDNKKTRIRSCHISVLMPNFCLDFARFKLLLTVFCAILSNFSFILLLCLLTKRLKILKNLHKRVLVLTINVHLTFIRFTATVQLRHESAYLQLTKNAQ